MKTLTVFLLFIVFSARAQQPELEGGLPAFVKTNIVYPAYARYHCLQGVVEVSFKLNNKGIISGAKVSNGMGTDLADEALRVVQMTSGKWKLTADYDTTSLVVVPINFSLEGFDCERVSAAQIAMAINAYQDEQVMLEVIKNYYRKKENPQSADELKIVQLKAELGIDEDYLANRITDGLKKVKQGDVAGACMDFNFVKLMGSDRADEWLKKYCK